MNCPTCNAPLIEGAVFCGNCGSPVAAAQSAAPVQAPTIVQPVAQQPQQPQQYAAPQQQYQQPPYQQPPYQQPPYQQPPYQQPMGAPQQEGVVPPGSKSKIAAGLLAIFLGTLGIHKFYLGYTKAGIIMLLVSLLTFGIGLMVMAIIAFIEGIMYLTKSDWDFYSIYVVGEKQWF